MVLPNFIIIGAAKCGTTSLAYYLDQHPEIYMSPEKEPRFFAQEFHTKCANGFLRKDSVRPVMTLAEYEALFQEVKTEKAIGEASTEYIFFQETPPRIKKLLPDVKLIVILRNPVERAFSAYCYQLRDGVEALSFEEAIADEERRKIEYWRPGWLYKAVGFYYPQIARYIDLFKPHQLRIYLYEDLNRDPLGVLSDIFLYLGVDPNFKPDLSRKNVSAVPKSITLNKLLSRQSPLAVTSRYLPESTRSFLRYIKHKNRAHKPELPVQTRKELLKEYQEDILKLQELIKIDLSHWLAN